MNAIEVKNLYKSYNFKGRKVKAIDNVSFNVKEGEIFGLLGPNGAGKSTIINILSGILSKDSGNIKILGKDPDSDREFVKNSMNVASAYFGLSHNLTLYQNLRVYSRLYGVKNEDQRINELFEIFELTKLKDKKVITLSSGERTRLSLCKGLINNPKVLLLDECTVGLDPLIAERTRSVIKECNKNENTAILFTSHYMFEVEELCKRIAFMSKGKIIKVDISSNLKKLIKKQIVEMDFIKFNKTIKHLFKDKNVNVLNIEGNRVVIEINDEKDNLYRLLGSLFKRGHKLKDLRINRPTLDDIFIKIATEQK